MFQTGKNKWRSLENTAKIFPATSSAKDERVFRFACELRSRFIRRNCKRRWNRRWYIFRLFFV